MTGHEIHLRPLATSDLETLFGWRNNPALVRDTLGHRGDVTRAAEKAWLQRAIAAQDSRTVILGVEAGGALAGYVRLDQIDAVNGKAVFGILLGPPFQGRGLGLAATRLALDHAFGRLGLHRVSLEVRAEHTTAIAVYGKAGFLVEGRAREAYLWNGTRGDLLIMGVLASDYAQLR